MLQMGDGRGRPSNQGGLCSLNVPDATNAVQLFLYISFFRKNGNPTYDPEPKGVHLKKKLFEILSETTLEVVRCGGSGVCVTGIIRL